MKTGDSHYLDSPHKADSFFGGLDPRAKLVVVVAFLTGGFFAETLWYSTVASALFAAAIVSAGTPTSTLWRISRSILILAAITLAFHLLFSPVNTPTDWKMLGLSITAQSLFDGLYYSLRLMSFALAALFLSLTTEPVDLAEGVVKICRPLRIFRVPVDDLGLILSLAFRFIPILKEEMVMIKRAQTLRGVTFSGNYLERIRNSVPLLVPVFVSALNRADNVALAIEARGYVHNKPRSYYSHRSFGLVELYFVLIGLIVIAGLLFWNW